MALRCRKVRPLLLKNSVLGKTHDYKWWWGSCFRDLKITEYLFIVITPRSTLAFVGQADLFKIYSYSIAILATFRKQKPTKQQLFGPLPPISQKNSQGSAGWTLERRSSFPGSYILKWVPSFNSGPDGWGCWIHQLHLCRGVKPATPTSILVMTLSNLIMTLQSCWIFGECGVTLHCHHSQFHSDPEW